MLEPFSEILVPGSTNFTNRLRPDQTDQKCQISDLTGPRPNKLNISDQERTNRRSVDPSDSDLIGPKMKIQDAIKIKLLQWENEFERVEHF